MKDINIDKITHDLLKKGLQSPENAHFDDELMKKIQALPKSQSEHSSNKLMKNGWRFLVLSLGLLIASIAIVSYLSLDHEAELSKVFLATKMYILFGGMALFIPLLFLQLDGLLKLMFQYQIKSSIGH